MKTTITILLLSTAVFITACSITPKPVTTEVIALRDITEPHLVQPKAEDILPLYEFDKNQWNGGVFSFSDITQVSFNRAEQVSIDTEPEWLSNRFQREKKVKTFQEGIESILTKAGQTPVGKNNSSVYFPIAGALNALSQSSAERKYLLLYTDLMENEPGLSFYRKGKLRELDTDSDSLRIVFENQIMLSPLKGITIYLLYTPADPVQDEQYKIVSKFYKNLFEDKGAAVKVTPNITN